VSALADLLERHVPYASTNREGLLCLTCVDVQADSRHGEYPTSAAWAAHVEAELRAAGLAVTRPSRNAEPAPQQEALL
jgi:hypothetical protein